MNRRIKTIVLSMAIIGIGIFTTAAMSPVNPNQNKIEVSTGAEMNFEATEIALGDIPQGIPVDIAFELTNDGNAPLIIESVKPSCGCTGVDYPKTPIKSGDSAKITAVYNAKSEGSFTKTITVFSNASEQPQVLRFTGVVK